jgi:AraC-like DNA-binding protein
MKNEAFHEHSLNSNDYPLSCILSNMHFGFPPHYHQDLEMIYVERGTAHVSVMQKDYELKEGQLAIIGCNHIHSYNKSHSKEHLGEDLSKFYIMKINWDFLKVYGDDEALQRQLYPILFDVNIIDTYSAPMFKDVKSLIAKLYMEKIAGKEGKKLFLLSYLYLLIGIIVRGMKFDENLEVNYKQMEKEHALLSKVNAYIFAEYQSGINLTRMASALGYSEFHFSRLFKRYTGIAFKQYLTHYQISMAKEDVMENEETIADIAFKHGFNSVKTFNRLFKSYYGVAPTGYRQKK